MYISFKTIAQNISKRCTREKSKRQCQDRWRDHADVNVVKDYTEYDCKLLMYFATKCDVNKTRTRWADISDELFRHKGKRFPANSVKHVNR